MTKPFDCVDMKHQGARAVRKRLHGMTQEQQAAYWTKRAESARRRRDELAKRGMSPDIARIREKWLSGPDTEAPEKDFDCVEMMHRGAEHVRKMVGGMTREQELAFWKQQGENQRQKGGRKAKSGAPRARHENAEAR